MNIYIQVNHDSNAREERDHVKNMLSPHFRKGGNCDYAAAAAAAAFAYRPNYVPKEMQF